LTNEFGSYKFTASEIDTGLEELDKKNKIMLWDQLVFRM